MHLPVPIASTPQVRGPLPTPSPHPPSPSTPPGRTLALSPSLSDSTASTFCAAVSTVCWLTPAFSPACRQRRAARSGRSGRPSRQAVVSCRARRRTLGRARRGPSPSSRPRPPCPCCQLRVGEGPKRRNIFWGMPTKEVQLLFFIASGFEKKKRAHPRHPRPWWRPAGQRQGRREQIASYSVKILAWACRQKFELPHRPTGGGGAQRPSRRLCEPGAGRSMLVGQPGDPQTGRQAAVNANSNMNNASLEQRLAASSTAGSLQQAPPASRAVRSRACLLRQAPKQQKNPASHPWPPCLAGSPLC